MKFKKLGKIVFGVELTAAEQKAMDKAIDEQCRARMAELIRESEDQIDAQVLWFLHERLGFGHKRLERVYYDFAECVENLAHYYEMPEDDGSWLCEQKLKDYGIDISELKKGRKND